MPFKFKSELKTSGSGNWTIPDGCKFVWVTMCGGGAGGGGGAQNSGYVSFEYASAGGGGGAESVINAPVIFYPGDTVIAYSVGAGGLGGLPGLDEEAGEGESGGQSVFGKIKAEGGSNLYGTGGAFNNAYISGTDAVMGASGDGGGRFGASGTSLGATSGSEPDSPKSTFWNGGASAGSGSRGSTNSGFGGYCGPNDRGSRGAYNNGSNTGGSGGGASAFGPGGDATAGVDCTQPDPPTGYGGGGAGGGSRRCAAGAPGEGGDGAPGFILICWVE